jgi:hypothetical protein
VCEIDAKIIRKLLVILGIKLGTRTLFNWCSKEVMEFGNRAERPSWKPII